MAFVYQDLHVPCLIASRNNLTLDTCPCGSIKGSVLHFFFDCDRFAALRSNLFASAAHLLGTRWSNVSKQFRLQWFLKGNADVSFHTNVNLFLSVQSVVIDSKHFS